MEKMCTNVAQSELMKELGFGESTADLFITPKVGGYTVTSERQSNSIPAWSLVALLKLLPNSVDYEDYCGTLWQGGCVMYLAGKTGMPEYHKDMTFGDSDSPEIGTGPVANTIKAIKWFKDNDYVPNIPWKDDDYVKRSVWLKCKYNGAVRYVSESIDQAAMKEAYARMQDEGITLQEASENVYESIGALMNQYGYSEAKLSVGWWEDLGNPEDIIKDLNRKRYESNHR